MCSHQQEWCPNKWYHSLLQFPQDMDLHDTCILARFHPQWVVLLFPCHRLTRMVPICQFMSLATCRLLQRLLANLNPVPHSRDNSLFSQAPFLNYLASPKELDLIRPRRRLAPPSFHSPSCTFKVPLFPLLLHQRLSTASPVTTQETEYSKP
mmetsp:Transcript_32050/g.51544  ORF Transcript_32050/g.51544 Transcript_32050/m.51544 type:complete len:152 (+) Transcript_32050:767-1222(+)